MDTFFIFIRTTSLYGRLGKGRHRIRETHGGESRASGENLFSSLPEKDPSNSTCGESDGKLSRNGEEKKTPSSGTANVALLYG